MLEAIPFMLIPLVWLACIVFAAYSAGKLVLGSIQQHLIWPERFFLNTTFGLGCLIVVMFILGLFHLWYAPVLIAVFALFPIISIYRHWKGFKKPTLNYHKNIVVECGLIFVICVYFLPDTFHLFYPEGQFDAITYHLPLVRGWSQDHGMTLNTYLRYPLNTLNFNLLYTLGYVIQGETLARSFHVLSVLLLICGIYAFGYRFFNRWVGFFAALFFLLNQDILNLMHSAYIDLGLTLFVFACLYCLFFYEKHGHKPVILGAAFMLAMLVGTKYLGLLYVLPLAGWAAWLMRGHGHMKFYGQFIMILLVFGSYWYVRNVWYSGNPIHPFAQSFFGYWLWTPADLAYQNKDLLASTGVDRTWLEFMKLPYHLLNNQAVFRKTNIDTMTVLGMVCAIPALFHSPILRKLGLFVLLNLIFWFFTSQIPRYLMPTMPFLGILAAFYLVFIGQQAYRLLFERPIQIQPRAYVVPVAVFLLLVAAVEKIPHYYQKAHYYRPMPTNQSEWQSYYDKRPLYELAKAANLHPANGGLFNLDLRYMFYYYDGLVMGDWFGEANMKSLVESQPKKQDIIHLMQKKNLDFLAIKRDDSFYRSVVDVVRDQPEFELLAENALGYVFYLREETLNE